MGHAMKCQDADFFQANSTASTLRLRTARAFPKAKIGDTSTLVTTPNSMLKQRPLLLNLHVHNVISITQTRTWSLHGSTKF